MRCVKEDRRWKRREEKWECKCGASVHWREKPKNILKIFLENMENSMMSESSLKKDWLSPEEDDFWKDILSD